MKINKSEHEKVRHWLSDSIVAFLTSDQRFPDGLEPDLFAGNSDQETMALILELKRLRVKLEAIEVELEFEYAVDYGVYHV